MCCDWKLIHWKPVFFKNFVSWFFSKDSVKIVAPKCQHCTPSRDLECNPFSLFFFFFLSPKRGHNVVYSLRICCNFFRITPESTGWVAVAQTELLWLGCCSRWGAGLGEDTAARVTVIPVLVCGHQARVWLPVSVPTLCGRWRQSKAAQGSGR